MDKSQQPPSILPEGGAVTSPRAAAYAERVGVKRYNAAVGGAPPVHIPPLDAEYTRGQTMAAQARPASPPQGSIFGPQGTNPFAQPSQARGQAQILPTDLLPEEARRDPNYREGPGSAYAMTQPQLVTKYGLIRGGQRVPPQAFRPEGRGPSQGTMAAVAAFNDQLSQGAAKAAQRAEEAEVEKEISGSVAGAARSAAESAGGADPKLEKALRERIASMDKLDLHRLQEMGMVDLLNNTEQRDIIEARCSPITLDEYVMNGFVRQRVPIVPGVFEVTFQSMVLEDELAVRNLVTKEANSLELSDKYLLDKHGYMGLAVSLYQIHASGKDIPFPSHLNNDGVFDEKLFFEKFKRVLRLPFHLAASLVINFFWFEVRVRRLARASKSEGVA